jgi:hypothetical protein
LYHGHTQAGCLAGGIASWSLAGWLFGWLAVCLGLYYIHKKTGWLASWLAGWLDFNGHSPRLAGWIILCHKQAGWLAGWLAG